MNARRQEGMGVPNGYPPSCDFGLLVHYQPICDDTNHVVYQEALARLKSDDSLMYPCQFLAALRRAGKISEFTSCVLIEICETLHRSGVDVPIAINVPRNAIDDELSFMLLDVIEMFGIAPERLVIEVTEDEEGFERNLVVPLLGLSAYGIRFVLDDYVGSETQQKTLKVFLFETVKIDCLYTQTLDAIRLDSMFRTLRELFVQTVIIKGVETDSHENWLNELRERYPYLDIQAQGFRYALPSAHIH